MNLFQASIGRRFYKPLLVIINGESNSGGYALNSEAPSGEKGVQSQVQILNNTTLIFEDLNIGGNNLIDHAGLSNGVTHGFELELAIRAITGGYYNNVHLIKTGQGGSQISQWNVGGGYFNKFDERITAAKTLIDFSDYNIIILFSLGINDAISGTNVSTWKTNVTNHFVNMRSEIGQGDIPIIMTEFQGMGGTGYPTYCTAIQELAASISNVYSIDVTGAGLRDTNHWNYIGMKSVAGEMLDIAELL
jgi:Carbohydrate esterase, sialic acid-specific acetylesterase